MTAYVVSSGQTSSGITLNSGDTLTVLSGGTASATTINSGGSETVLSGGLAETTTVSGGGSLILSGGAADNIRVLGTETVSSGGGATSTTILGGGFETVSSGGTTSLTTVVFGGTLLLNGGAINTGLTWSGGTLEIGAGFTLTGQVVSFGTLDILSGGTAIGTNVSGSLMVSSGGTATSTVLNGGMTVSSGGMTTTTTISGGTFIVQSGGSADTTSLINGTLVLDGGAVNIGFSWSAGTVLLQSGGSLSGRVLDAGQTLLLAEGSVPLRGGGGVTPGSADDITLNSGADETVNAGALTTLTTVNSGGSLIVKGNSYGTFGFSPLTGSALSTIVNSGGSMTVSAFGDAVSTTVSGGGSLTVSSGGVVEPSTINSGTETVLFGGKVISPSIAGSGVLDLLSGAIVNGGITFSGTGGQLQIAGSVMPSATIFGFASSDTFDLTSIAFDVHGSANLAADNQLQITEGGNTYDLNLDPGQFFSSNSSFLLSDDGAGGTSIHLGASVSFTTPQLVLSAFGTGAGGWSSDNHYPRALGDVNGDGKADIVGFGQDGVWASLATGGGGFAQPVLELASFAAGAGGWTSEDLYPRTLGDVTGNGRDDIIGFGQDGVWEALANADGSFAPPVLELGNFGAGAGGWTSQDTYPRMMGDVTGDGRDDIVGFGRNGVWVSLANADGSFAQPVLELNQFGSEAGGWTSQNTDPRVLADVTGDGKADIVGFGQDGVWVSLANGDGSFAQPKLVLGSFAVDAGGWTSQDQYPRLVADVTGEGKADIIGFGQDGVWVSQATGNGTFAAPTFDFSSFGTGAAAGGWTSDNLYPRLLADVNGKHAADIVGFGISGVYTAIPVGFT